MFPCSVRELKQLKFLSSYIYPVTTTQFTQTVRWQRKPRWIPPAKSKLFRIPVRPVISEDEKNLLKTLHANYKTQVRAVRTFFREEIAAEEISLSNLTSEKSLDEEATEFKRCMEENDRWNSEVAKIRELRLREQARLKEMKVLATISRKEKEIEQRTLAAKEKLEKYKEQAKTFITRETLDEAIQASLNNVVDYNFAIDYDGNIYAGREGGIEKDEEKVAQTNA